MTKNEKIQKLIERIIAGDISTGRLASHLDISRWNGSELVDKVHEFTEEDTRKPTEQEWQELFQMVEEMRKKKIEDDAFQKRVFGSTKVDSTN